MVFRILLFWPSCIVKAMWPDDKVNMSCEASYSSQQQPSINCCERPRDEQKLVLDNTADSCTQRYHSMHSNHTQHAMDSSNHCCNSACLCCPSLSMSLSRWMCPRSLGQLIPRPQASRTQNRARRKSSTTSGKLPTKKSEICVPGGAGSEGTAHLLHKECKPMRRCLQLHGTFSRY